MRQPECLNKEQLKIPPTATKVRCGKRGAQNFPKKKNHMMYEHIWPLLIISNACRLATLVVQSVKNLPAMREIQVWFLGREDPLEKGMATPSSIRAWRIPWTEEPGGLRSIGLQRVRHDWSDLAHTTWVFKFFSSTSVGFTWAAYFKCKFLYSGP